MRRPGRKASIAVLAACALMVGGVAAAQEPPPNLQMLLNLDLFADNARGGQKSGGGDSMVEQIRTLHALGHLRTKQNNQRAAEPEDTAVKGSPETGQTGGSGENQ